MFHLCAADSDEQHIFDQTEASDYIIVLSMLQNWSHMYSVIIVLSNLQALSQFIMLLSWVLFYHI